MSNQPSYATDEECRELREQLIAAGYIRPASAMPQSDGASKDICLPEYRPEKRTNSAQIPEEGSYEVRPILTNEEYEKRRMAYLYMLQSILRTRNELERGSRKRPKGKQG